MLTVLVAFAAGLGAVARYAVDEFVTHRAPRPAPYGTFVVNISGSLLLGVVVGVTAHHHFSSDAAAVLGVGFAGGYTTLSTWAWESVGLALAGRGRAALANVAGSLAVGLLAAAAGLGLALL